MTPGARLQAAIECLDLIFGGMPAEQVLTRWGRKSRYAGSGDRAAVRDHVFDALRCRRSFAARGGADTGRGVMLGALREAGADADALFSGPPYAPEPPSDAERAGGRMPAPGAEAGDVPDWLWPRFAASLGDRADAVAMALRTRAPVHVRVNLARGDIGAARAALGQDGIDATPHPASATALELGAGARRLRQSRAYLDGLVELQDAGSQAVVDALPLKPSQRVLDLCAGGGGKTLAIAARGGVDLFAHDAAPERMRDLPARAARAGASVQVLGSDALAQSGPFDLVLCDVPCSGSGAWRRAPDGKWRLTPGQLDGLLREQAGILRQAAALTAPGGILVYVTCSLLEDENGAQIRAFLDTATGWRQTSALRWNIADGTDGFFAAHLTRP